MEDIQKDVMRYIWGTIVEELCISITCLLVSEVPFKGRKYLVCCISGPQKILNKHTIRLYAPVYFGTSHFHTLSMWISIINPVLGDLGSDFYILCRVELYLVTQFMCLGVNMG